ncbi:MAG: aminotransferase class III-fold pyridoxal phosphate-dependent enzyme, partial [Deltaproteobacteria bacterium]|nr:aminotransferase class III-fold pyridoxal phosphate-dependent enzyme [Deltaproteobacteria bacterium]
GTIFFQTDDPDSLARCFAAHAGRIAALFIEPSEALKLQTSFVQRASELSRQHGALLILDETDSSFRLAKGGAQAYFSVSADLVCLGPAAANGYGFAAVTGPRGILRHLGEILTPSVNNLSGAAIAAAISTLQEISDRNVVAHLWEQGRKLRDGLAVLAREFGVARRVDLSGPPPFSNVVFLDELGKPCSWLKQLFAEECRRRGVLFSPRQRPSFSHREPEMEQTLRVYRAAMEIVGEAIRRNHGKEILEGKPVQRVSRTA